MASEPDFSSIARVIGEPARARMLYALLGGRALPATDLARTAEVAPSTASVHLAQLIGAGLVTVERRGRHRYHRLAGAHVADAVEALAALAPMRPIHGLRAVDRVDAERAARSCYDHLAGTFGVAVTDRLCAIGALDEADLSLLDPAPFIALGVAIPAAAPRRRPLTRACLDWSERRPHLAGALGAAMLQTFLDRRWLTRRPNGRALAVTAAGQAALGDILALDIDGR
jgi:DNA-binding transcriptional ArsR family regulator